MISVFLFFILLILITLFLCLAIISTLKVDINNLYISNLNNENSIDKFKIKFVISIQLILFNKIKILSSNITDEKIKKINEKFNFKEKFKKVDLNKIKSNFKLNKDAKEYIKKYINNKKIVEISKIDLDLKIGTEDVIVTSILTTFISTIISLILTRVLNENGINESNYKILPLYYNQNLLNINLKGIFSLKIVHIIFIIFNLLKKGRVDKNGESSNRRTYDYSYE